MTQWRHDAFHNNALSILASQLKVGEGSVLPLPHHSSTKTPFEPLSQPHPKNTCLKLRSRMLFLFYISPLRNFLEVSHLKKCIFEINRKMLTTFSDAYILLHLIQFVILLGCFYTRCFIIS